MRLLTFIAIAAVVLYALCVMLPETVSIVLLIRSLPPVPQDDGRWASGDFRVEDLKH